MGVSRKAETRGAGGWRIRDRALKTRYQFFRKFNQKFLLHVEYSRRSDNANEEWECKWAVVCLVQNICLASRWEFYLKRGIWSGSIKCEVPLRVWPTPHFVSLILRSFAYGSLMQLLCMYTCSFSLFFSHSSFVNETLPLISGEYLLCILNYLLGKFNKYLND